MPSRGLAEFVLHRLWTLQELHLYHLLDDFLGRHCSGQLLMNRPLQHHFFLNACTGRGPSAALRRRVKVFGQNRVSAELVLHRHRTLQELYSLHDFSPGFQHLQRLTHDGEVHAQLGCRHAQHQQQNKRSLYRRSHQRPIEPM